MIGDPEIVVLHGGPSAEREVSLASGRAVATALEARHRVRLIDLRDASLPGGLDPNGVVVAPMLHGTFGEDGTLQREMESRGIAYAGCDAACSELCIDKVALKKAAAGAGVKTAPDHAFTLHGEGDGLPDPDALVQVLGSHLVLKPVCEGSSVGLRMVSGREELRKGLESLASGRWMVEVCIPGREISVGLLNGVSLGIVEIIPEGGVYDYAHKYTAGKTRYEAPANLDPEQEAAIRNAAETVWRVARCRDFARVDFRVAPDAAILLEINTLPGMVETSLLPKSAAVADLDFAALCEAMIAPARQRFHARKRARN